MVLATKEHNPYATPTASFDSEVTQAGGMHGLVIGLMFSAPQIIFAIQTLFIMLERHDGQMLWFLAPLSYSVVVPVATGYWWGIKGIDVPRRRLLPVAIQHGAIWMLGFFAVGYSADWYASGVATSIDMNDFKFIAIGVVICSLWNLLMGASVRWSIRRKLRKAAIAQ